MYKREGKERYLYITRKQSRNRANSSFLHFESWCRKGPYYGCNEGVDLELRPSGFFEGTIPGTLADIFGDLCAIDKAPDQFRFNPYFGNSGSSGKGTLCPVPACEGCPDCHFKTLWNLASDAFTSTRFSTNTAPLKCFSISSSVANYTNAITACQAQGGDLATISSSAEDDLVQSHYNNSFFEINIFSNTGLI